MFVSFCHFFLTFADEDRKEETEKSWKYFDEVLFTNVKQNKKKKKKKNEKLNLARGENANFILKHSSESQK